MKKLALLVSVALSMSLLFAACSTSTEPETSAEPVSESSVSETVSDEVVDVAGTTWQLTDGTVVDPESGTTVSGDELTAMIGSLTLEFGTDGQVTFTYNDIQETAAYEQSDEIVTITEESGESVPALIDEGQMILAFEGASLILSQQ